MKADEVKKKVSLTAEVLGKPDEEAKAGCQFSF